MTNRREFLHLGVAALSLPIAARAGVPSQEFFAPSSGTEAETLPLYKAIFDERFAACRAFAGEMKRRGLATHGIRGDVTDVWFNDLYHVWKERPAAISGSTAPGAIFCLETLARDAGMRVALRVDHHRKDRGEVTHEFWGPEGFLERAAELQANGVRWPERMAELLARFPAEPGLMTTARFPNSADADWDDAEHLVTWLIAPAPAKKACA